MLAIRNFGHYWSKDLVHWGAPGSAGELPGYILENRQPRRIDFREQIAVYVLYGVNREVVYVGQAGIGNQRLFQRLKHHTRNHLRDRWTHFSWFGFRDVNDRGDLSSQQKPESRALGRNVDGLNEIEAVLLQLFEPGLNKQGPRWGAGTTEFLQYVPDDWEDDDEDITTLDDLWDRLEVVEKNLIKIKDRL